MPMMKNRNGKSSTPVHGGMKGMKKTAYVGTMSKGKKKKGGKRNY